MTLPSPKSDADVQRIRDENLTPDEQYKKLVHSVALEVLGEKDYANVALRLDDFVQESWGIKAVNSKIRRARYKRERLMRAGTYIPGDTDNSEDEDELPGLPNNGYSALCTLKNASYSRFFFTSLILVFRF